MDLYKEMLIQLLAREETLQTVFPDLTVNAAELVEAESYRALQKIKAVIEDDSLDDCMCVEEIVCILERMGSNGGDRHDFG